MTPHRCPLCGQPDLSYDERVRAKAELRQLVAEANRVLAAAYRTEAEAEVIIAEAEAELAAFKVQR